MLLRQNFLIILVLFGMVLTGVIYLNNYGNSCNQQIIERDVIKPKWMQKNIGLRSSPGLLYNQPRVLVGSRTDVASVSPWSSPIIWEGTFDSTLIDSIYKQQNLTIATTVFALGKYTRFIKVFWNQQSSITLLDFECISTCLQINQNQFLK
ncbi:hypothetical protein QQF64_031883 [Cirrhinus molitorella]|uniref:Uncharacterized protein n=1 Tax=Cirrhinus molitorella TaxID=172907 RepID=A0ABR3MY87_9TELE